MDTCMICGKKATTNKPMALVGSRHFFEPAPSGYQWKDGKQPSTRVWKLFALLDVGICQNCVRSRFRRHILTRLATGCAFILASLPFFLNIIPVGDFLPVIFSIIGACVLLSMFGFVRRSRADKLVDAVTSHYLKTGIPKEAILAAPEGIELSERGGLDLNQEMIVHNVYNPKSKSKYKLSLVSKDDLYRIGQSNPQVGSMAYAPDRMHDSNIDETRAGTKGLFEKIGINFDI